MMMQLLGTMLVGVVARMLIEGPSVASELATAIIALLLLIALRLGSRGRRLGPPR